MKTNREEMLRWLAIIVCGGFAICETVTEIRFTHSRNPGGWGVAGPDLLLTCVVCGPFYAMAYFCWRRQYRQVSSVLAPVAAILVFCVLLGLPEELHLYSYFAPIRGEDGWIGLRVAAGLCSSLLFLLGPFYAAWRVLEVCRRLSVKL